MIRDKKKQNKHQLKNLFKKQEINWELQWKNLSINHKKQKRERNKD